MGQKCGLIYDNYYEKHDTGLGHPESPMRATHVYKGLLQENLIQSSSVLQPEPIEEIHLRLAHDPKYLARRILRMALEDIGLADPDAQNHCLSAWQIYERLGSPEGELALAGAVVYLALAPKSNASYVAYKAARQVAKKSGSLPPPKHVLNAPTELMKDQGYGQGYDYDHDAEDGFSGQSYFPDDMARERYYYPVERGFERDLLKRVKFFDTLRAKRNGES